MKKLVTILAFALTFMVTSCGHNFGTVVHGKFVNLGYDPELNKFGIQYVDGVMMTGMNKEKSKNAFKFTDSAEKGDAKTTTIVEYTNENGAQVTGYQVDLVEAMGEANVDKDAVIQTKKDVAEIVEEPK